MTRTRHRFLLCLAVLTAVVLAIGSLSVSAEEATDMSAVQALLGNTIYQCGESTLTVSSSETEAGLLLSSGGFSRFFPFSSFRLTTGGEVYGLSEYTVSPDEDGLSVEIVVKNGSAYVIDVYGPAYEFGEDFVWYDGIYINPDLPADGSMEYPWQVGATEDDDVKLSAFDGVILVDGFGAIRDYEDPADRPWADAIGGTESVFFGEAVTGIGKNAFRGLGSATENGCAFFLGENYGLLSIGESAFEGAELDGPLDLPTGLLTIGSRAFAGASLSSVTFYGGDAEIADDAFAGATAEVYTISGEWKKEIGQSFGGNLSYCELVRLSIEYVTEDEETVGSGYVFFEKGEQAEYDLNLGEDFAFERWEVLEGKLDGDPTEPVITAVLNENVKLKVYGRRIDVPGSETENLPFAVTRDGVPAKEGTEYVWDGEACDLTILSGGLTVSMADGIFFADARIDVSPLSGTSPTLTLNGICLVGMRAMISAYTADCELILRGDNRVTGFSDENPAFFGGSGLILRGNGSLTLSVPDSSHKMSGVGLFTTKPVTDGLTVKGSVLGSEEATEDVVFPNDGTFTYVTSGGSVCKTLIFSPGKTGGSVGLWIGGGTLLLAAGVGIFFLIKHKKERKTDEKPE